MPTKKSTNSGKKIAGTWSLLADSFKLYKEKFWRIISLMVIAPGAVIVLMILGALMLVLANNLIVKITLGIIFGLLFLAVAVIALVCQTGVYEVIREDGRKHTFEEAWLAAWKKAANYFGVKIWECLMVVLWCLLLIIPGIIMGVYYSMAVWVYFYEGFTGRAALKRSKELVKGYWWPVFGRLLLVGVMFGVVVNLPVMFLQKDSMAYTFCSPLVNILSFLIAPVIMIFTRNIYLNLIKIKGKTTKIEKKESSVWAPILIAFGLFLVICLIGMVATLGVVGLSDARVKARDARRFADVKKMQIGLELYFNDHGAYPDKLEGNIDNIPRAPEVPAENACGKTGYEYKPSEDFKHYKLQACFEGDNATNGVKAGENEFSEIGL